MDRLTSTPLYFDYAATTPCCEEATASLLQYANLNFGNPSSSHTFGQEAAKAVREARLFFANYFRTSPEQIIFTGSGSEANNLAICGVAMDSLANKKTEKGRILYSAIEHPAVRKTVQSLVSFGFETHAIPVDPSGQINEAALNELLTPNTVLVSIQQVNNIMGAILPVEDLAKKVKKKVPSAIFHTDAIQAFGKLPTPVSSSEVDLLSMSAHKIEGPKGIGALAILEPKLLKSGLRPLIWGGDQEGGFRSGTQSPGLISGFYRAAEKSIKKMDSYKAHTQTLNALFKDLIQGNPQIRWNSPKNAVPHIINLSIPGFPPGPLAKLLDERGCLISTGSACSSSKMDPDFVLKAMGYPTEIQTSAIRVSFSDRTSAEDVKKLATALNDSIIHIQKLLGGM